MTLWLSLKNSANDIVAFRHSTSEFSKLIATTLGAPIEHTNQDKSGNWFGNILNIVSIFGNQMTAIPLIFQRGNPLSDEDQDWLRVFLQSGFGVPYSTGALVLWNANLSQEQLKSLQDRLRTHAIDLVLMHIKDVLDLLESPNAPDVFRGLVLRQATLTTPFVTTGPVPDSMFFGRVQEMERIAQYLGAQRSCALIGGRRIGKTSILQRLYRSYLPQKLFRSIYFDCSVIRSYEEFLASRIPEWRPDAQPNFPRTFGELFDNPPTDRPLVLLLDEVDKIVDIERRTKWQLFNRLRGLINSGKLQVVLCGEQSLRNALRNDIGPLFNMPNEIVLGPLESYDVADLVVRPIRALEIDLVDQNKIVEKIYNETMGHPNVVQRLCARLTERMNRNRLHRITPLDVDEVVHDPAFQRDDLLNTYWAGASVLEKTLSLLIIQDLSLNTARALRNALKEKHTIVLDIQPIDDALQNLVSLRSILRQVPEGYTFAVKPLEKVFQSMLGDLLEANLELLNKNLSDTKGVSINAN
jgi:hypothetical protein